MPSVETRCARCGGCCQEFENGTFCKGCGRQLPTCNTHYAVVAFSGDAAGEHPDEDLRGKSPHLEVIACGPEAFCWDAAARWTERHPLRMWEEIEVLARDDRYARKAVSA